MRPEAMKAAASRNNVRPDRLHQLEPPLSVFVDPL
jgi:hypothetical protein